MQLCKTNILAGCGGLVTAGNICVSLIQGLLGEPGQWVLGDSCISKYPTIFDASPLTEQICPAGTVPHVTTLQAAKESLGARLYPEFSAP
jgi:hypothetical protein